MSATIKFATENRMITGIGKMTMISALNGLLNHLTPLGHKFLGILSKKTGVGALAGKG